MISEDRMKILVSALRLDIKKNAGHSKTTIEMLNEAIDLIPLGWQVANNQEDSRVGVALGSDDND